MAKRKKKSVIHIRTESEIAGMRAAGAMASRILQATANAIQIGKTTGEIDQFAAERMKAEGCKSAFLDYRGFPGNICISVNEEVVHGIGNDRVLHDEDLVKVDVGISLDGWIGDNATTVPVGDIPESSRQLLAVTEESLYEAISYARAGEPLAELCSSVESYVKARGYSVVRDLVGHGVGRDLHEEPQVPNYRPLGRSPILKPGMILAIEPMINAGRGAVKWLDDGWTVATADKKMSAHFEHTVLITESDPEILTDRPRTAWA